MAIDAAENPTKGLIAGIILAWSRPRELAGFAEARHGFCNSDGCVGIVYPEELDPNDREVNGIEIPPGHVLVFDGPDDDFNRLVPEAQYLSILAEELKQRGFQQEAERVEAFLIRSATSRNHGVTPKDSDDDA